MLALSGSLLPNRSRDPCESRPCFVCIWCNFETACHWDGTAIWPIAVVSLISVLEKGHLIAVIYFARQSTPIRSIEGIFEHDSMFESDVASSSHHSVYQDSVMFCNITLSF